MILELKSDPKDKYYTLMIHIIEKISTTCAHTDTQELPRLELNKISLYRIESRLLTKGGRVYTVWYIQH